MDQRLALDGRAAGMMVLLCFLWGLQQVVLKGTADDVPPVAGGGEVGSPVVGTTDTPTPPTGATGSIILITNIAGGQLLVDGTPVGDAQHGREVSVLAGAHQVAISQAGAVVAQQNVNVLANVPTQVQLVSNGQVGGTVPSGVPAQVQSGSLAAGDSTLNSGEFVDRYNFQWTAGQRYAIDARSSAFDTYLIIKPPSGAQIDNDDRNQAAGTDAGYDLDVSQTGTWQVLVTSFRPGEVGAYTLSVQQLR